MKNPGISPEFLSLTYGIIVREIIDNNYNNLNEANKELFNLGFNIGIKLSDEFISTFMIDNCKDISDIGYKLGVESFKHYLNIESKIKIIDKKEFIINFNNNPFEKNLELSEEHDSLVYSNIICGIISGALDNINIYSNCNFEKSTSSDYFYQIRVQFYKKNN